MDISIVVMSAIVLAFCGLVLGVCIGVAVKIFKVDSDPRVEAVAELLPGANCGGCGLAGCADFAAKVVEGSANPAQCVGVPQETRLAIARVLGVELKNDNRKVAVVLCSGTNRHAAASPNYNGVADCVSAALVAGGPKECSYGCIGLSSCARICPFGAISVVDALAVVDPAKCVGCGQCTKICPRHLIQLVPAERKVDIYCSSPEKAPAKKAVCSAACIGCRKCVKAFPDYFAADGFRAVCKYEGEALPDNVTEVIGCPSGCLQKRNDHKAAAAGEEA